MTTDMYDVVIIGGGPAGMAAALTLGRATRRVAIIDGGYRRNRAAEEVHGFLTQDGTPPDEMRRIAAGQLSRYRTVTSLEGRVERLTRTDIGFSAEYEGRVLSARYVLLCTGMVDEPPAIAGAGPLWGTSIVQCPYCHGWEVRGRAFGYLARTLTHLDWVPLLRGWTSDVTLFTNGAMEISDEQRRTLGEFGVAIETRRITQLIANATSASDPALAAVELEDGTRIHRDVLFYHPAQRQTDLVLATGAATDSSGFVVVDAHGETSVPGLFAGGDLTTGFQSATIAAASGFRAGSTINHRLITRDRIWYAGTQ